MDHVECVDMIHFPPFFQCRNVVLFLAGNEYKVPLVNFKVKRHFILMLFVLLQES